MKLTGYWLGCGGAPTISTQSPQLGITLNLANAVPNDPGDPVDREAARRIDALANRMFLDPMLRGSYPADLLKDVAAYGLAELVQDTDLAVIAAPIDFLGVNHYRNDNVSGHRLPAGAEPGLAPTDPPARRSSVVSTSPSRRDTCRRRPWAGRSTPLDNFEWACGYSKRFGIVRVDYESQVCTIKDSGREYARIMASAKHPLPAQEPSAVDGPATDG